MIMVKVLRFMFEITLKPANRNTGKLEHFHFTDSIDLTLNGSWTLDFGP